MRASNRTTEVHPTDAPSSSTASPGRAVAGPSEELGVPATSDDASSCTFEAGPHGMLDLGASHPIAEVAYRRRAQVGGRVRSIRVRPWGEVMTLEAVIADETAAITVAFLGRRSIAGIKPGGSLTVEGMVGQRNGKLVILNPAYDLRAVPSGP